MAFFPRVDPPLGRGGPEGLPKKKRGSRQALPNSHLTCAGSFLADVGMIREKYGQEKQYFILEYPFI